MSGVFDQVLALGVAVTRVAAAFSLTPLFAPETVPPLVRNSLYVGFALIVVLLQPGLASFALTGAGWMTLFLREALIGLVIGFFFATILWAFEAAGEIIDAKVGATIAQIIDPLTGHQESLNGAFLARLANFVFMFSGGLLLMVNTLLESYAIWPLSPEAPPLRLIGVRLFELEFSRLMMLAVLFAAPAVVVLHLVETGLGLVNRFAPQLNVFALSLPIKAWLATFIILTSSGLLIETLVSDIAQRPERVLEVLRSLAR